jgi:signal transduction histidine kinase
MGDDKARPTREETDARLRIERGKTDDALEERAAVVEQDADEVLQAERKRAEELLEAARQLADDKSRHDKASPAELGAIEWERSRQDEALRQEHAQEDQLTTLGRDDRDRILAGFLANERDNTDRSLLLERVDADEIVAKRDDFLGMVSHDLRNELGGIGLGMARLIKDASDDDAGRKVFRIASNVQRTTVRMSRLIGDLLDVVSIEVGKLTVVVEECDVARIVDEVIESFHAIAAAKDISLNANIVRGPLTARCDRQRILQVLGNLVTNALKFTSAQGRVTVCAERKGDDIWCSVTDTGSGIAADRMEAIFERFTQGNRADRNGLGLGLYIAKRIVDAHGGRIWAESSLGRGSTFTFTLRSDRADAR